MNLTEEEKFKLEALDHNLSRCFEQIAEIKHDMAKQTKSTEIGEATKKTSAKNTTSRSGSSSKSKPKTTKAKSAAKRISAEHIEYKGKMYLMKREAIMLKVRDSHVKTTREELKKDPAKLRIAMVNHPYYFSPIKDVQETEEKT